MKLQNTFLIVRQPIVANDGDSIKDCTIVGEWYTPPLFRRPRLHRFASLVRQLVIMQWTWKWLRGS
jgi:hypothetical protein